MILIRFSQVFLVLFFSLALTGCSLGGDKAETTVSPFVTPEISAQVVSESSSPTPMAFASAEIVKTVKDLLDKGEEIPEDTEKAFLEYGAKSVVNILLNTTAIDPMEVEKEIGEIQMLFQNFPLASVRVITSPSSPEEFLSTKKEEREICFSVERFSKLPNTNTPEMEPEILYTIQKGNGCDSSSFKESYDESLKKAHDASRIADLQFIKTEMEILYVDNLEYSKNIPDMPKNPKTGEDYNIVISSDKQKYCISTAFISMSNKSKMENDYGDDPLLYEVGNGCKEL